MEGFETRPRLQTSQGGSRRFDRPIAHVSMQTSKITHQKRKLRAKARSRIATLHPDRRREQEHSLRHDFWNLPGLANANTVLLYVSRFAEEIDTRPLLQEALQRGLRLVLPRVCPALKRLSLAAVANLDEQLEPGALGIDEPSLKCEQVNIHNIDWVLVPGLAFDENCHRLGRGAGYYDRLLDALTSCVPRWALAFEEQCFQRVPTHEHDREVTGILTPARCVFRFDSKRGIS